MGRKGPRIFAWTFFIISEVAGIIAIIKAEPQHAKMEILCMVFITGHGMVLFRLLPGVRTFKLKVLHFLIHTVSFVGGFVFADEQYGSSKYSDLHKILAYITLVVYVIQWFLASFIYLYLYSNQSRRKAFAGIHNFVGICLLQFAIATCVCMLQETNFEDENEVPSCVATFCLVIYGMTINIIVLNPYLEWRLIGRL